jgi:PPOX class probable F420-dependent enzyme
MAASNPAPQPTPAHLDKVQRYVDADHQVCFITTRRDGTSQATLVRGGLLDHPISGRPAVVSLIRGNTAKLRNLRRTPRAAVFFRGGSDWATAEGPTTIIGPDDPHDAFDRARFEQLRRAAATAVARSDKSQEEFERIMEAERRAVVLVEIDRVISR